MFFTELCADDINTRSTVSRAHSDYPICKPLKISIQMKVWGSMWSKHYGSKVNSRQWESLKNSSYQASYGNAVIFCMELKKDKKIYK